jgi:hypothetical protein
MAVAFDRLPLSTAWHIGIRRRQRFILNVLVLVVTLAIARLVLYMDFGAVYVLVLLAIFLANLIQPRYGLYVLLAVSLFFDSSAGPDNPIQYPGFYLTNSPQTTLHFAGGIFTPTEIFLFLVLLAWLARCALARRFDMRAGDLGLPALLLSLGLAWGIVRGLSTNANVNLTLWESRFLVAMVICYFLAANLIRTRTHVQTLLTLIAIVTGLSGIEGIWRKFAVLDGATGGSEFWYAHEDVVMWGLLIFLVFGIFAFGGPRWQLLLGPLAMVATVFTMLLSERRAGYIAVIIAFVAMSIVLFMAKRRSFWLLALPVIIAGAVYMPLFWNNGGTLGQPARAVRSLSDPDPRDASSNAWRDLEAINVRATIQSNPLLGIGFGNRFLQVVTVPSISFFTFWDLEAHHDILWVWMKTGAFGFAAFFMFVLSGVARCAWMTRHLQDRDSRVFALVTLCGVVMSLVFCYVDLGLVGARIPMVLGILLGASSVLPKIQNGEGAPT